MESYKIKCLKNLPKQVTGVIVYSVRNTINQYCKRDSKKLTELVGATKCANNGKKELDYCYAKVIDNIQGTFKCDRKIARSSHVLVYYVLVFKQYTFLIIIIILFQLPSSYFKFYRCIEDKLTKSKFCDAAKVKLFVNFFRDVSGNTIDLLCNDYVEGSDKCDKLGNIFFTKICNANILYN